MNTVARIHRNQVVGYELNNLNEVLGFLGIQLSTESLTTALPHLIVSTTPDNVVDSIITAHRVEILND